MIEPTNQSHPISASCTYIHVCVCMCTYTHAYIHICIYTHAYAHTYACVYIPASCNMKAARAENSSRDPFRTRFVNSSPRSDCVSVHMCACVCVYMCICVYMYVYIVNFSFQYCACACVCMFAYVGVRARAYVVRACLYRRESERV